MATNIPPHNAGELCDAALHLIKFPNATADKLVEFVPGPDFPTGGIIVEPRELIVQAYKTGRGSFRLRARWTKGGHRPRHLPDRRHRDSLSGSESAARRPASPSCCSDEEAAAARRRARRERGGRAPRARAEEPHRRSCAADGVAVQADRARDPLPLNMNVLSAGQVPNVLVTKPGAAAMARSPQGGARPPLAVQVETFNRTILDLHFFSCRLHHAQRANPRH